MSPIRKQGLNLKAMKTTEIISALRRKMSQVALVLKPSEFESIRLKPVRCPASKGGKIIIAFSNSISAQKST